MVVNAALLDLVGEEHSWRRPVDFQRAFANSIRRRMKSVKGPTDAAQSKIRFLILKTENAETVAVATFFKPKSSKAPTDRIVAELLRDLMELEAMVKNEEITIGYVLLVTDDSKLWAAPKAKPTIFDEFRLFQGRKLGSGQLTWGADAADGSITPDTDNIELRSEYSLNWQAFSASDSSDFRYLLLEVGEQTVPAMSGDDIEETAREGDRKAVVHLRIERQPQLVLKKKRDVLAVTGRLECEVCTFNFAELYGARGNEFCEVHHRVPLATFDEAVDTKLSDLAIVCANCHRMLHRSPWVTVEQLRDGLKSRNPGQLLFGTTTALSDSPVRSYHTAGPSEPDVLLEVQRTRR